jgi:hypothetical protein
VTPQKAVVEKYADGFRKGDLAQILACLTDDVVWALHGAKTLVGKEAFAAEAASGDGPNPELTLDRLIVGAPPALRGGEGDTVAVIGHGSVSLGNDPHDQHIPRSRRSCPPNRFRQALRRDRHADVVVDRTPRRR